MPSLFVSPEGKEFEIDNPVIPEVAAWIKANGLKQKMFDPKDAAKSGLSGGIEGIARTPLIMGDFAKLLGVGLNKVFPGTISDKTLNQLGSQGWIDAFRGSKEDELLKDKIGLDATYQPQTTVGEYVKPAASAVTGAATMSGMGAAPGLMRSPNVGIDVAKTSLTPGMAAINAGSGAAGQLGYDVSRSFDPTKEGSVIVALLASGVTGIGANAARSALTPNGNQVLYNATKGMTDKEWAKTLKDWRDFNRSGSNTWTLADLPELQPRLGGTAQGLSNTTGGDLLQQRLSLQNRMNKDIPNVVGSALDDVHAPVDARELAATLAAKGDARIGKMVQTRGTQMEGTLANAPNADPAALNENVAKLIRMQMIQGKNQNTGAQQALSKAEESLLGKGARNAPFLTSPTAPGGYSVVPPTTNVQSLSKEVKSLRDIPTTETGSPRTAITRYDRQNAGNLAEEALAQTSPEFRKAMDQYRAFSENILDPAERSLTGTIRDAKDASTLLTRLRGVPPDRLQAEINSLGLSRRETLQLARVVGEKVDVLPNLTKASDTAKLDRHIFDTLVDAVNPDLAKQVGKKLSVADALSRLSAEHSADRTMNMNLSNNPVSTVVNPFGTISRRAGLRTTEAEASRLSELIANPTKENLSKIREIAKVDPRAKRFLEALGTVQGSVNAAQEIGDVK